jgi:hypothetical protein
MATGHPGEQVSFSATFDAQGADVAAVQSAITFDSFNVPIAPFSNGKPDCTLNPSVTGQPSFVFQKFAGCHAPNCACTGNTCTAIQAAVYPPLLFPPPPLPDGAVLYTCRVNIASNAAPGEYPLTQNNVVMSDPLGLPISNVGGSDGGIVVLAGLTPTPTDTPTDTPATTPTDTPVPTTTPTPTDTLVPTATPTATPTDSPTATPTVPASPTPTNTIVPCIGDCDGSGDVTVNELITLVNIALGNAPLSACVAGDADHSGEITIDEILRAVNNALGSCPST